MIKIFSWAIAFAPFVFVACGPGGESSVTNAQAGSGGGTSQDAAAEAGACQPATCLSAHAECGVIADGCGKTIACGGCEHGQVCGGGGTNRCGIHACTPKTCIQLGAACGIISDGCGNVLDCGSCPMGMTCGNTQIQFQCVAVDGGTAGTGGTAGSGGSGANPTCTPGEACDDGDACTVGDLCNHAGQCEGGTPVSCTSPPNGCFVSSGICDSLSGLCSYPYKVSGTPCDDEGNACTIDKCDGAGQCVHIAKSAGTPCPGGTCVNGVCNASCPGGVNVTWSQSQSAWNGNPKTAGNYTCSATLPSGSHPHGATVPVVPNQPKKRMGNAVATCESGAWKVSGSCDGNVIDTAMKTECAPSSPPSRKLIASWYVADLVRCADSAGLDYWVSAYDDPASQTCTAASNYQGMGSKDACWRATFRDSANAAGCYDQTQATGHICDSAASNLCEPGSYYPWTSILSAGTTCKVGP
ncbi:MAG TPA: hypothetical protein PL065_19570 [Polyangiaceae bacterium]|nr:hypothetical protein [Polyangiaceae bacterium]